MNIKENVSLKEYSTLQVGGIARFFATVTDISELQVVFQTIRERKLPFFVLGGGSNTYFSDKEFPGFVVNLRNDSIDLRAEDDDSVRLRVGSGKNWDEFVSWSVTNGFCGLENLSYIPGSVGAAPIQNIGAYGVEVKDVITSVEVFDITKGKFRIFSNDDCRFAYRDSFFKTGEGKNFVVTSVDFKLSKKSLVNISYRDLGQYFENSSPCDITASNVREAVIDIRKKKLPNPMNIGTLGSFFKNPIVTQVEYEGLQKKFPKISGHEFHGKRKLSAAWLIDHVCGLRGYRKGALGTYETQPLAIVNYGGASAGEVVQFAQMIKSCVQKKTGIVLREEVNFVFSK